MSLIDVRSDIITPVSVGLGGTGATAVAGARTNLGLVAGGTGDIWVEKAGDTMTAPLLVVGSTNANQLAIKGNATQLVNIVSVQDSTSAELVGITGGGNLNLSGSNPRIDFFAPVPGGYYIERSGTNMNLVSQGTFNVVGGSRCQLSSTVDAVIRINGTVAVYVDVNNMMIVNGGGAAALAQFEVSTNARTQFRLSYDYNVHYGEIKINNLGYMLVAPSHNRVAIGTTSSAPLAKLHIFGNEDLAQEIVQGHSTQTANLTEWRNSAAAVKFAVGPAGQIKTANSVAATIPGMVVNKLEIFDAAGVSLGFIPIYNTIT